MDKHTDLISRLQDEADLCRNDGANDIAALLDEAVAALRDRNHDTAVGEKWRTDSRREEWFPTHITIPMARLIELETAEHERDILRTENAALKREAHTWSKAAEHYAKPLQPLDPLDVEELWDVANADPYADEVHHEFARLLQRKLGIGA